MNTKMGVVQWFRFEEREEVRATVEALSVLGVRSIRTAFSWADWERPGGEAWFDFLMDTLASAGLDVLPTIFYTPLPRAEALPEKDKVAPSVTDSEARTSFPPARLADAADFCETMLVRYGKHVGPYVMIWNEVNNDAYWSPRHDPTYAKYAEMAKAVAEVVHRHNKKVVLAGIIPPYLPWLETMRMYGTLDLCDALGIQAFPGTWDKMVWKGWPHAVNMVRQFLTPAQEVWITETGLSTVTLEDQSEATKARREREQIEYFETLRESGAERAFWHCVTDQDLEHPTDNYLNRENRPPNDPRAYYFGLIDRHGRMKPLFEHWRSQTSTIAKDGIAA